MRSSHAYNAGPGRLRGGPAAGGRRGTSGGVMHVGWKAFVGAALLGYGTLAGAARPDLTQLSVEELMQVSVYSASKFEQKASEAPASVSVITAEDIRAYGHRTLADILKSVRGLFVGYDRNYAYLGVRGFDRPGDYDSRILLLVDGYRVNDPIYDTAGIGTEFLLDVDQIERLEIVRGPGSAIYGSNAFFAVINVITRRGPAVGRLEASAEGASFGTDKQRVATGGERNGVEWLLAASRYHSDGPDLYFPGFDDPATNDGRADGLDSDRYEKVFGNVSAGGATLTAGYSQRDKQVPTASFGSAFGDPREETTDRWTFADIDYALRLDERWELAPHVSYSRYTYHGTYPIDYPPLTLNRDLAVAQWWNTEIKLTGRFGRHRLVTGVEYQNNFRQDQLNYDEDPYASYTDSRRSSERGGIYAEDEFTLTRTLRLTGGGRYDHYSAAGDAFSPRAALVWDVRPATTVKLLGGSAFRAPNQYELYYGDGTTIKPNPGLDPEEIATWELVGEHLLGGHTRLTADFYNSRIRNLIEQVTDPNDGSVSFQNLGRVEGTGAEFEVERSWRGTAHARLSYAWQRTRDRVTGIELTNSPRHLAKLNVAAPLPGRLLAGTELQYVGTRRTLAGATCGAALVGNLTLTRAFLANRLTLSGSAYNLLDRDYADPARPEHAPQIDEIPQDGRSFRLRIAYAL